MEHLCYNDICAVISALSSQAEHYSKLADILTDGAAKKYALESRNEALRLKHYFSKVGDRLLDIDLGASIRIPAKFHRTIQ